MGDRTYDVTGRFNGAVQGEEYFVFEAPLSELGPAVSPAPPLGFTWSGAATESAYKGVWSIYRGGEADGSPSQGGTFELERLP